MLRMINLLMCGNSAVADGLMISLLSITEHTDRAVNLILATMDMTGLDERYTPISDGQRAVAERILMSANSESRATLLDMTDKYRAHMLGGKNEDQRYTPYAMIRLLADLYPMPDRLLYLDTDTVACRDIGELYDIPLDGKHVVGVRDYYGSKLISPRYMNSGVMLWDLAAMRRDGVLERARTLCCKRRMLLPDQSALNKYARKKLVKRKYNEQHKRRGDTVIQHFSMRIRWFPKFRTESIKPWDVERLHNVLGIHDYDGIIEKWRRIKEEMRNEEKAHTDIHGGR